MGEASKVEHIKKSLGQTTFDNLSNQVNKIVTQEKDKDGYQDVIANVYKHQGYENDVYFFRNAPDWIRYLVGENERLEQRVKELESNNA